MNGFPSFLRNKPPMSRRRLLEETGRLRKALQLARKGEERADGLENDLAESEVRCASSRNAARCAL